MVSSPKRRVQSFSRRIGWHLWRLRFLAPFRTCNFVHLKIWEIFNTMKQLKPELKLKTSNIPECLGLPVSYDSVTDFCIIFHGSPGAWATSRRCRRRQCTSNGELPITRALDKKNWTTKDVAKPSAFFERSHVDQKNVLKHRRLAAQRILGAFHPIQWAIITACPFHFAALKKKTELENVRISPFHSFNASQCFLHKSTSPNWLAHS